MMNRKADDFDSVLNSLSFSSSAENNVGGLDEALQQFAEKKAEAIRRRRGPIEGIPEDELAPEQFEIAEDAMLCAHFSDEEPEAVNLPSSAPEDVSHCIERIDPCHDKFSSSAPDTTMHRQSSIRSTNSPTSTMSVCPPSSSLRHRRSFRSSRLRFRHRRPRTTSPSGNNRDPSVYLQPSDIVTQPLCIPSSSAAPVASPANVFRSTYLHGAVRLKKRGEMDAATMNCGVAYSLPDLREGENGSLRFKCTVPNNEVSSMNLTKMDRDKISGLFECGTRSVVAPSPHPPPKRPSKQPPPYTSRPVLNSSSQPFGSSASPPTYPLLSSTSTPINPISDSSSFSQPTSPQQQGEVFTKPELPLRRRKKLPSSNEKLNEGLSLAMVKKSVGEYVAAASTRNNNSMQEFASDNEQFENISESSTTTLLGLITEDLLTLLKRNSLVVFTVFSFAILFLWYFSVFPFLSGALLGGGGVYVFMRVWAFAVRFFNTYSPDYHPEDCYFTRGGVGVDFAAATVSPTATCCSLHNSLLADWRPAYAGPLILPHLRDLQSPPVPHLVDENPKTGPAAGHLGELLGFKLDKNNKPLYQGWMNETVSYSPETYHSNYTHSVFVTLEGTQLRIQRPRKNVPRRAMFNVPVPSSSGVQFVHQRIYDMRKVTVTLLPEGLVGKRLWSKKYPICLIIQNEQNSRPNVSRDSSGRVSSNLRSIQSSTVSQSLASPVTAYSPPAGLGREETKPVSPGGQSAYSVSTSRFLRVSTNSSVGSPPTGSIHKSMPVSKFDDILAQTQDDFLLVQPSDLDDRIYLFTRTCREKETWYRRLFGASIGKPLLLTTQQAFKQLETISIQRIKPLTTDTRMQKGASFSDLASASTQAAIAPLSGPTFSINAAPLPIPGLSSIDSCYDPDLQVTYLRYMAKFIPAQWLSRSIQALKVNLNYVKTDSQLPWLNALFGRFAWDFLKHEKWRKRVQDKIQAKIKKIKFNSILNEPVVTNVEMGNEWPIITNVGKPYLDNQGLWLESELVYTGGFTVTLQTTMNVKKLEKLSRQSGTTDQSPGPAAQSTSGLEPSTRSLAAFLSDEEDSADSSTDSERDSMLNKSIASLLPNYNPSVDLATAASNNPNTPGHLSTSSYKLPAEVEDTDGTPTGSSKGRFHRIFDKITRSLYVQMADSKLVQYSLDLMTQTTLHLKIEVTMLHGNLVVNIPPPPSNRLWYGFRGNPNLRLKVKPKVGDYLFNFPRILEAIEKRLITEFQRVVVLPNMDDLVLPMLFIEENLQAQKTAESKTEDPQNDAIPTPPQYLLHQKNQDAFEKTM